MATFNDASSPPIQLNLSHQVSILDLFFPGFTGIWAAAQQLLGGNLNTYARLLCICGMLVFLGTYAYRYLWELVAEYFTSAVHVSYSNEAYDMLITWVSTQPLARKACSSLASVGTIRRRVYTDGYSDGTQKKPLHYIPWNGSFFFWYKNHLLIFRCMQTEVGFHKEEQISVSCIGRSPEVLKELFCECRTEYLKLVQNKTSVFEHRNDDWKRTRARDIRKFETVILNEKVKKGLLKDIKSFLDPKSRKWYSGRGIPYRRGYLLYGPPGTGKSSLSLCIAGCFDLDIYILNLSSVDDGSLSTLFADLPPRCVVLLEDVDAAAATQSRETGTENSGHVETVSPEKVKPQGKVSLSCLLNVLDGVASQEGRVLIMTTNHVERLDGALIRPGRVDKQVEFGLADKDIIAQLFCNVYSRSNDDIADEGVHVKDDDIVEQLATEFADKVPQLEFSPAEILSFLLENRQSPDMAVKNVQQWTSTMREEKKKVKRADSWCSVRKSTGDS